MNRDKRGSSPIGEPKRRTIEEVANDDPDAQTRQLRSAFPDFFVVQLPEEFTNAGRSRAAAKALLDKLAEAAALPEVRVHDYFRSLTTQIINFVSSLSYGIDLEERENENQNAAVEVEREAVRTALSVQNKKNASGEYRRQAKLRGMVIARYQERTWKSRLNAAHEIAEEFKDEAKRLKLSMYSWTKRVGEWLEKFDPGMAYTQTKPRRKRLST